MSGKETLGCETSAKNNPNFVCPESTIESANRRNFIRKAAIAGAAVAVGGSILGKAAIPGSSAESASCCGIFVKCNFLAWDDVILDIKNQNDGTLTNYTWVYCSCTGTGDINSNHALTFGSVPVAGVCCNYSHSGEGIASARTSGSPNRFGLDFYTCYTKRVSITKAGNVGIGPRSCAPSSTLYVNGCMTLGSTLAVGGAATLDSDLTVSGTTTLDSTLYIKGCNPNIVASTPSCFLFIKGGIHASNAVTGSCIVGCHGVLGTSCSTCPCFGAGVTGLNSSTGPGVVAISRGSVIGKFLSDACKGDRSALVKFGNGCSTPVKWNVGVAGCSNASTITKGDFYVQHCGTKPPAIAINSAGHVGLGGALNPSTTLKVCGSFAAKVRSVSSTTTLLASDFAILASGAIMLTLPAASTQNGMVIFIKNTSTSTVTVKAGGSDKIEAGTSKTLSSQFASLTLISNGLASPNGVWYILSNAT